VELGTGQGTALPLPDVGLTTVLGFDAQGRPVALVEHYDMPNVKAPERVEEKGQAAFVFEGQKYPIGEQGGVAGLAHAYRREGNAWKRVETKVSSYMGEAAEETGALELAKALGPNTALAARQEGPRSESVSGEEAAALEKSAPEKKSGSGGEEERELAWARFPTPAGPVYHREEHVERAALRYAPLRWEVGGTLVEPEKLKLPEDSLWLESRGTLLLVTSGEAVRLYDVKQKKQLLSLDGVYQPRFWPLTAAPKP
jgi:hypothetical protein